ncbi:hypothetical protein [Bacillus benzoevorans]|uniref:DUF3888 domain-containing protein n=1 Tax=Bacillus benzoevorans TaxID=1456 RepID=A0A7X0HWK0_9BACI|nr:hypothetical protein [Bacillus benzoevorans]MBB6447242.1 hypothetical protein [Bacillus benzoevorans]
MKKALSMVLLAILFVTPFTSVNAAENKNGNTNVQEIYATPNDMILDFIQIKADNIIQKEYGKQMMWGWFKIKNDKHIIKNDEKKRWYELTTVIIIQDPDNKEAGVKFDSMTFKFTPRVPGNDNDGDLGDTKFELLEYKRNDAKAY